MVHSLQCHRRRGGDSGGTPRRGSNFRVRGWLWWRRIALPAVMPYYVTGAITASGGSWNASIVAEVASWGDEHLQAVGLGAYIAEQTDAGDFHRIVFGIAVMSLFVVIINRLFWRPLYLYAERKFRYRLERDDFLEILGCHPAPVVQFQYSHLFAARRFANVGIEDR